MSTISSPFGDEYNDGSSDESQSFDASDFFLGPSSIDSQHMVKAARPLSSQPDLQTRELELGKCLPEFSHGLEKPNLRLEESPRPDPTDDYIALGAIRLSRHDDGWHMVGPKNPKYPHKDISFGQERGWVLTNLLPHGTNTNFASLKIFVLPEDVGRSNRGSIKHLRKVLKLLADFVDISPQAWSASYEPDSPVQTYKEPDASEEESMFYIFNTLSSPHTTLQDSGDIPHNQQAMRDVLEDNIAGLSTLPYAYQKRSIAAMLQKEVHPSTSPDPRKPQFQDLNGTSFYFDAQEGVLLRQPHLYSECRGGILAETMGYGKSLICIALMLATRGHYCAVPEGRVNAILQEDNKRTPSLLALAAKKTKQAGVPWKVHFATLRKEGYHFDSCTEALSNYDGEYTQPLFHPTTPNRVNKKREEYRVLRRSYTTLLIVPPNLLIQWQSEIKKHTHSDSLDVLVLDSRVKEIPHWKNLMQFDVVLITKARFEQEYRDDDLNQGKRYRGQEKFRSQLTELRWLRVICDEGHGFAGSSYKTNAMAMLDKMSIERRWVVSGTPSQSLHGVEVSLSLNETDGHTKEARKKSITSALKQRKPKDVADEELKDLDRLRALVVKFLKVQPWANQKGSDYANFNKYIHPYSDGERRRFAPALKAILQSLIVRHRIEDVDFDLSLPPLSNITVCLEPTYYDKLSLNLFRMVLASNAITSERVDDDYMFQPKNKRYLDELINNLRRSSFHWVGFVEHEVKETVRVSEKYLDDHLDTISDADGVLLTEAILSGERAIHDSGWKAFSYFHEIGVYIADFPTSAAEAWALDHEHSDPVLLGTKQAREAQQHVLKHIGEVDPGAGLTGAGYRAMLSAREKARDEADAREKVRPSSSSKSPTAGTAEEPKVKHQSASSSSTAYGSKNEMLPTSRKRKFSMTSAPLPLSLAAAKIVGFTSAKLNYLCSRVLVLQDSEKIIIFYDSNNIAFWIAEALELLSVKFLIYANTLSVTRRAAYLAAFNQSETFRVLLMDLKQASHGLHIAAATRIFIVSPIWQPDVEAQAIKRAHRIGQTRPVFVETLVLKGTLEEKMLSRRRQMSNAELVKAEKSLLDDATMNEIIRGEGFLKVTDREKEEMKAGKLAEPVSLFERRDGPFATDGNADNDLLLGLEDEQAGKRRRRAQSKTTAEAKAAQKAVKFAPTASILSPPVTPAPQAHVSIFGNRPSADGSKLKKSVGFFVDLRPGADAGSSSDSGGGSGSGSGGLAA